MARVKLRVRCGMVLGAALLALGAACTPTVPGPEVTPSSPPTETDRAKRERLEYEAAEKAYRAAVAETERIFAAGGADEPTELLNTNATGAYLEEIMDGARNAKEDGWHLVGQLEIAGVIPDGYDSEQNVRMLACEDGSGAKIIDKSGKDISTDRVYVVQSLWFVRTGEDGWRVAKQESRVVETLEDEPCMN